MLVPKSFLDDLRSRIRLSEIIGKRLKMTRAGREFKACCPFHHENTPSFYVNDEKGFYHCFGCGAHGDHLGFLIRNDNKTFMDAVEELAAQAGLSVPKPSAQEIERAKGRDRLVQLMEDATSYFKAQLFENKNQDILKYLTDRGLNEETIHAFRLGYAPESGQELTSAMRAKGYNEAELLEAGLSKKSKHGSDSFAFFRDRVMFPVTDRRGNTIAFGGRVIPEHIRPPQQTSGDYKPPKYINSSDTTLFQKGHILFNESNARAAAAKGEPVVVCEGYADVIALWQAGFPGAVAPLGTAITEAQINALWAMIPESDQIQVREPFLCFDGDNAGQRAATRALSRILPLLKGGVSSRFMFLPGGMDPDDLIRAKGSEAFKDVMDKALPMIEMIWHTLTWDKKFDTPEARAGLQRQIENACDQIADRAVQRQYIDMLKNRLFQAFRNKKGSGTTFKQTKVVSNVSLPDPRAAQDNKRAQLALASVIYFPDIFEEIEDTLGRMPIETGRINALRQNVIEILSENADLSHNELIKALKEKDFLVEISDIVSVAKMYGLHQEDTDVVGEGRARALQGFMEAAGVRALACA